MSWLSEGANYVGDTASGLAKQFGNPGHNGFTATPFQNAPNSGYDPNAFQGGWNNPANGPFSLQGLAGQLGQAGGMQAPGFAQSQAGLGSLAQQLQAQANGTAPSLAAQQLRQAQQTNAANTMAMEAQQRGMNPSMAALNAGNINAQANQQTAAQGVQAQLAERNAAQGMLGNVYGQMGGMGLQQQAQNNAMVQYFTSQGMSAEQAQQQANIAQQGILAGSYNAAQGLNAGISQGNAQNSANLIGGIISGAATLGGAALGAGASAAKSGGGGGGGAAHGGLVPIHPGIVAALRAHGGLIPGQDPGPVDNMTDGQMGLRSGEVVVNQENPEYERAKAAVQGQNQSTGMQGQSRIRAIARAIVSAYSMPDEVRGAPQTAGVGG